MTSEDDMLQLALIVGILLLVGAMVYLAMLPPPIGYGHEPLVLNGAWKATVGVSL